MTSLTQPVIVEEKKEVEKPVEVVAEQTTEEKIIYSIEEKPVEEKIVAEKIIEEKIIEEKIEEKKIIEVVDPFMPTLSQTHEVESLSKITVEKLDETPVFFEISSAADQIPVVEFDMEIQAPPPPKKPAISAEEKSNTENKPEHKEASKSSSLSSGGYLAKPSQIYVEEQPANSKSNSNEEPTPLQITLQEDEPVIEMQLVVKDSQKAAEEKPDDQTQPIMMSPVEEPAMQDETEELRRRATERIAKLRNLSFNINAADPNNEFETVPAYLRRNMEMHNQIADVESFYSNYTVKSDENNQAEIGTINTFLDGKKPD
jgi:cell division protein FtsZ